MTGEGAPTTDTRLSIADEHRELLRSVRGLETILEASSVPATGDVARRLYGLAELLAEHIVEEERSPLYSEYPLEFPEFAGRLARLRGQHHPMVEELRKLGQECDSAERIDLESELSIRVRQAIAHVRRHEADESEVVHAVSSARGESKK